MRLLPDTILEHLGRQHGLVTRQQVLTAGVAEGTVDHWAARGPLERVLRGVYRLRGLPVPPEQPLLAAVLRTSGWLTGEGLLALLGVEGCNLGCVPAVVVQAGRSVTGLDFPVLDRDPGPEIVVRRVRGVRPEDAVLDLAGDLGADDRRVRTVIDATRWKGVVELGRLVARARALPCHPGAERILAMDAAGVLEMESEGERELVAFLGPFATLFRRQARDVVPGRRLDLFDDESRLNPEYDGRANHTRERDRAADAARDREAEAVDVLTYRVRKEDIRGARAAVVLADLLAVRASRVARLAGGAPR